MSLLRALLLLIALALLAGLVPAWIVLDRRLARELEVRARQELALTPALLADREAAIGDALMMHAKEVAHAAGLAQALRGGDRPLAFHLLEAARGSYGDQGILVGPDGQVWSGPSPDRLLMEATRRGEMPVAVQVGEGGLVKIALAPVELEGAWVGAAGLSLSLNENFAGALAGLTRSAVVILGSGGELVSSTLEDSVTAAAIARAAGGRTDDAQVQEVEIRSRRFLVVRSSLDHTASVLFLRDLDDELAVLPQLRRVAAGSAAAAIVLGLLLGAAVAAWLARPVHSLSTAADRLSRGDFDAPLKSSSIAEINRLAQAFRSMRVSLAARVRELEAANQELAERQERLRTLQAELVQRERLAASGQLVAQLAHEIRNPIANLRNCLEVIRRRGTRAREFTDLAIDELLRMHELVEQLLDLHRPREDEAEGCDVVAVVREVKALTQVGVSDEVYDLGITGPDALEAAISPEALKQVLLNLVQNARDAMPQNLRVETRIRREGSLAVIEMTDNGPGISTDILHRVFEPFVTTKSTVGGTGLGLFVAEGIVRNHGGRITAANRINGQGAHFRVELLAVGADERKMGVTAAAPRS